MEEFVFDGGVYIDVQPFEEEAGDGQQCIAGVWYQVEGENYLGAEIRVH